MPDAQLSVQQRAAATAHIVQARTRVDRYDCCRDWSLRRVPVDDKSDQETHQSPDENQVSSTSCSCRSATSGPCLRTQRTSVDSETVKVKNVAKCLFSTLKNCDWVRSHELAPQTVHGGACIPPISQLCGLTEAARHRRCACIDRKRRHMRGSPSAGLRVGLRLVARHDVVVADAVGRGLRRRFVQENVPDRDPVAPPQLPRYAPVLHSQCTNAFSRQTAVAVSSVHFS